MRTPDVNDEIRIGVSACLLGENVRFDGGHKRDPFITDVLQRFARYVPVCPEVDIGLGTPREPIRLQERAGEIHLVGKQSATDHTKAMQSYGKRKVKEIEQLELSGYILKKDSPSCGMERVRVYGPAGAPRRSGRGMFATALLAALPDLPVEEEGRLQDARLRENFVERVFAYRRLQNLFAGRWTVGSLVHFHAAEKLLLLAHDPEAYSALGRLVAAARRKEHRTLEAAYRSAFMAGLAKLATVRKHVNVLQHAQGYFKTRATASDRRELEGVIADFRQGLIPFVVPITLLRHFVRRYSVGYLAGQTYLEPHPKELMLRNHV